MSFGTKDVVKRWAKRILENEILVYLVGNGVNIDIGAKEIRSKGEHYV